MKREEAKEILEEVKTMDDSMYQYNKAYLEALNMAIEALDQEPTTKNDLGVDCISRRAVNGYIDYILSHGMGKKKSFDFIKKFVTNLPSVTPQEPILDKIRAEINAIIGEHNLDDYDFCSGLIVARKLIDKYKAESEGKE